MVHALTIDVEDYYSVVGRDWLGLARPPGDTVVQNVHALLDLMAGPGVKATFFLLGEVVEVYPALARDIASAGHEVGVHGYHHQQVFKLTPESFRQEVADAKARIEDATGSPVEGHRAPAFSITPQTEWALDVLAELGLRYDSSVFPITGKRYGWPGFPREIHQVNLPSGRTIIEAPLSTVRLLGKDRPCCGGGYLRLYPYWYTRWAIRRIQRTQPAIVYMHPYEIDTKPVPRDFAEALTRADLRARLVHSRLNLRRRTVVAKLRRLFEEFRFTRLCDVISDRMRLQPGTDD